jgi:hypothetical protein
MAAGKSWASPIPAISSGLGGVDDGASDDEGLMNMKHAMMSAFGLGFLATASSFTPIDCGNPYVAFHERLSHHTGNIPGEQVAALHRGSLRIFDACDAGHLRDVEAKFVELETRLMSKPTS